jgi:hypothetical protein
MSYEIIKSDIHEDGDTIIGLWNKNNEKKIDQKFDWMYLSNPDGLASTWLVKQQETSDIVGMASVFPRNFRFNDRVYKAGIQGDFFIQKDHRSFGPALMLIRAIVKSLENSDIDFLYAFPNRQAKPIFRRAGYNYLGATKKHIRLLNINRLLADKTNLPNSLLNIVGPISNQLIKLIYPDTWVFNFGRFETRITNTIDFDIEYLLSKYHESCFTTEKTDYYLKWKYENDPDDNNLFFYIKDNALRVLGCIVFCIEPNNIIQIREILHTHNQSTLAALLALFFKHIKKWDVEYAYAQIYENSGFLAPSNHLDLTLSDQGRKIVYTLNPNRQMSSQISKLLHSNAFCLFSSDEDS